LPLRNPEALRRLRLPPGRRLPCLTRSCALRNNRRRLASAAGAFGGSGYGEGGCRVEDESTFLLEFGLATLRDLPDFEALEDAGLLSKEKLLAGAFRRD
jgi:hypothetical protein